MEGVQTRVYSASSVGVVSGSGSGAGNGPRISLLDSDKKLEKHQLHDQLQKGITKAEASTAINVPPQTNPDPLTNACGDFKENKPEPDHLQKPIKGQKMSEQEAPEPKDMAGIKTKADEQNGRDYDVDGSNDATTRYFLGRGLIMCTEFIQDQVRDDCDYNFTDLDMICSDGYVQVHRCLLMGASPFLRKMLIDKDIMDTTAISLSDVSVCHLKQVLSLLYTGRSVIKEEDEAHVYSLMSMLELPANELLCRPAKEKDIKRLIDLRHIVSPSDNESNQTPSRQDNDSFACKNLNEHYEDNQVQKGEIGSASLSLLTSAQSLPSPTILEKALTEECVQKGKVQNEDLAYNTKDEEGSTTGREMSSDSTVLRAKMIQKRKSGEVQTDEDDDKSNVEEEEDADDPKAEIYHRLRKRPKIKIVTPAVIVKKKKAVNKPRKNDFNVKAKANKKSSPERKVAALPDIKNGTQNDDPNHDDEKKMKDERSSSGTNTVLPPSQLCPVAARERQRRLSTVSSASSISSNGTTSGSVGGSGPSRVFLEAKELSGVLYNIYGLLDPVKGVQSGKTIAIIASKDKSRKSDGSLSQLPGDCR